MNRHYIVICKIKDLTKISPLDRLWYAESNSPNDKLRLSGRPDVLEVAKMFLEMLPPDLYKKEDAIKLMKQAVDEVFIGE